MGFNDVDDIKKDIFTCPGSNLTLKCPTGLTVVSFNKRFGHTFVLLSVSYEKNASTRAQIER